MKTLKTLFLFIAVTGLLVSCSKSDDFWGIGSPDSENCYGKHFNRPGGLDQDRYITMKTTGLRVHYRIIGKGPIDIVFIPGWTNPLEIYSKQFDYFRDKARCIYIDIPGQGLSDAPEGVDYTMGMMADAIYDVVKKEGIRRFVAVGFSMGPTVLGQFELKHPGMITKLVNLDGGFTPWPPIGDPARETFIAELEGFCSWMETWGKEEWDAFIPLLVPDSSPEDLKEFVEYVYDLPMWLVANIYWNCSLEEVNQPIGWTFPILSIYSAEPTDMDYEQLYFPDADIHVMEGSGHVVQWEKHEIVNPLIWKFINDRHWRPGPKTVTLPFTCDYIGNYTSVAVDEEKCGSYPEMRVIVDGSGTGTYVGESTIHFDFCCNWETGYYGYGKTYAYIEAEDGDILYVTCSGQVIDGKLDDHPDYVTSYWRDPFKILGGTGRFKGATGGGMTDDFNSSEDPYSHHHWKGTINLVIAHQKPVIPLKRFKYNRSFLRPGFWFGH